MRIDFVITELNVGGAEQALTEIAIGLSQRGHHIRVLSIGSAPQDSQSRLVKRLFAAEIEVCFGGFDHVSTALAASAWLHGMFDRALPELCQCFLFHANCLGTAAARKAGVSKVVGGLRVAESKRMRLWIERRAARSMDHLVCVSDKVREFAVENLSVPRSKCSVIANGVDVSRFQTAAAFDWSELGWESDSPVAVFVGRLHPQKGLSLIRQHAEAILHPSRSAIQPTGAQDATVPKRRLILIGDGPERESLEQWAGGLGSDQVRVLGWQNEVACFLKAAKMLVLPSLYEGMPNAVLEAMAAGLPVVCSRIEGSEELFGESDADFEVDGQPRYAEISEPPNRAASQLFDVGDGTEMTRLANQFFDDDSLAHRVGESNRRFVEKHFSIPSMVGRYEDLYQTLLRE